MRRPAEEEVTAAPAPEQSFGWQVLGVLCRKLQTLDALHWARPLDDPRAMRLDVVAEITGGVVGLESHQIYALFDGGGGTADGLMRQLRRAGASPREERGETALRGAPVRLLVGAEAWDAHCPHIAWWLLRALCWQLDGLPPHPRPPERMYADVVTQMIGDLMGLDGSQVYELFDWDCDRSAAELAELLSAENRGEAAPPAITMPESAVTMPESPVIDPGT
jgi:hypothetical protein